MDIENKENKFENPVSFFLEGRTDYGVLLVHGFTGCPDDLKELGDFLNQKGFTVLGVRTAGHGTGNPHDLIKTSGKDWLDSVSEGFNILSNKVKKIFLLGFSMGGNLCFPLVYQYPEKVVGLVTISTPVYITGEILHRVTLPFLKPFKTLYQKRGFFSSRARSEAASGALNHVPLKSLGDFLYLIKKVTPKDLPKINKPILIIHARKDRLVKPRSARHIYRQVSSGRREIFWVNSTDHHAYNASQEEIFGKIYNFFNSLI